MPVLLESSEPPFQLLDPLLESLDLAVLLHRGDAILPAEFRRALLQLCG